MQCYSILCHFQGLYGLNSEGVTRLAGELIYITMKCTMNVRLHIVHFYQTLQADRKKSGHFVSLDLWKKEFLIFFFWRSVVRLVWCVCYHIQNEYIFFTFCLSAEKRRFRVLCLMSHNIKAAKAASSTFCKVNKRKSHSHTYGHLVWHIHTCIVRNTDRAQVDRWCGACIRCAQHNSHAVSVFLIV